MTKIILDTNVLISALAFDAVCENCLLKCLQDEYQIYHSFETLSELKEKIYHGRLGQILAKAKRNLSQIQIDDFMQMLEEVSVLSVTPNFTTNLSRDPKDNKFLELAKHTQADYLITGDKDLLELKCFEQTKILKPSEFLQLQE